MSSLQCEYEDDELNRQNERKLCHTYHISMTSLQCDYNDDDLNLQIIGEKFAAPVT